MSHTQHHPRTGTAPPKRSGQHPERHDPPGHARESASHQATEQVMNELEHCSRVELARYLHDCLPYSAQWHAAMAVWHARFERLSRIQNYALLSVLLCAFIIALLGLLH